MNSRATDNHSPTSAATAAPVLPREQGRGRSFVDLTAELMGDPQASGRRDPTAQERRDRESRGGHPSKGVYYCRWSKMEVGETVTGLTAQEAYGGGQWLREHHRYGVHKRHGKTFSLTRTA